MSSLPSPPPPPPLLGGCGGAQGQRVPTQTSAQGKRDGDQRAQCLSPFPGPELEVSVPYSVCNMGKVTVLFPQFLLSHLFRFKFFRAFVNTVAITTGVYPLPQDR